MNPQDYMARLAGLTQPVPEPPRSPVPAMDQWNTRQPDASRPYNERFAGGALRSTYTPFTGNPLTYGQGPQHRFYAPDTTNWTGTSTGTATATATTENGTEQQQNGGPDGGQSMANQRDGVHGKSFDQMTPQELQSYAAGKEKNSIFGMSLPSFAAGLIGPLGSGAVLGRLEKDQLAAALASSGLSNPADFVGGQIAGAANTGMNVAGGAANPELGGRGDPSQGGGMGGQTEGGVSNSGVEGDRGFLAKGGEVTKSHLSGPDPKGPDDGKANLDIGEFVTKADVVKDLGVDFFTRLNAGKYDRRLLLRAVNA